MHGILHINTIYLSLEIETEKWKHYCHGEGNQMDKCKKRNTHDIPNTHLEFLSIRAHYLLKN